MISMTVKTIAMIRKLMTTTVPMTTMMTVVMMIATAKMAVAMTVIGMPIMMMTMMMMTTITMEAVMMPPKLTPITTRLLALREAKTITRCFTAGHMPIEMMQNDDDNATWRRELYRDSTKCGLIGNLA